MNIFLILSKIIIKSNPLFVIPSWFFRLSIDATICSFSRLVLMYQGFMMTFDVSCIFILMSCWQLANRYLMPYILNEQFDVRRKIEEKKGNTVITYESYTQLVQNLEKKTPIPKHVPYKLTNINSVYELRNFRGFKDLTTPNDGLKDNIIKIEEKTIELKKLLTELKNSMGVIDESKRIGYASYVLQQLSNFSHVTLP